MRSKAENPFYNARSRVRSLSVGRWRATLVALVLLQAAMALASDWQTPANQLAQRIAAIVGPGTAAVKIVNRSSLNAAETEDIRRTLLAELSAYSVQPAALEQSAATVQVSLSQGLQNYVWIAEIHQGTNEPVVVMVSVPGAVEVTAGTPTAPLSMRKSLLWTADDRILDVALMGGNPGHMIVLEPERIGLYQQQNGNWQQEQVLALVHVRPWSRDLRGRLILRKDHLFDAYLPGVYCRSSTTAPLSVTCDDSDDPWPLTANPGDPSAFFSATRNFFTGALSPGIQKQTIAPAFYSAAALPRDKYTLWVFAGVDGHVHFLDGMTDQTLPGIDWGSDVASVKSGCGQGWQVLATSNKNGTGDEISAFEIADREPVLVSQPAEFTGSITALWSEADSSDAIAVSRELETGKYEAYRLSIDCHR